MSTINIATLSVPMLVSLMYLNPTEADDKKFREAIGEELVKVRGVQLKIDTDNALILNLTDEQQRAISEMRPYSTVPYVELLGDMSNLFSILILEANHFECASDNMLFDAALKHLTEEGILKVVGDEHSYLVDQFEDNDIVAVNECELLDHTKLAADVAEESRLRFNV